MWGKYAEVPAPTNAPESRSGPDAAGEVTVVDVVHSPEVLLPQQTTEIAGEEGILELPSTIEIRVMNDSSSTQQGKADENANGEMSLLYHQAALEVQTLAVLNLMVLKRRRMKKEVMKKKEKGRKKKKEVMKKKEKV